MASPTSPNTAEKDDSVSQPHLLLSKTHTKNDEAQNPALQQIFSKIDRPTSVPREIAFISILISTQFMTQASLAQAIAPLSIIGNSFNTTNPGQLSWFAASYSLTVGTFILIAGRLGDIYGHKLFFVAGYAWFALWSLLTGFSVYSDMIFYDVCRAMQGIGPAFLLPNAIAIIGRTYEQGRRKQFVFSALGATAPVGFVVGAVFCSLLAELAWWPWVYWIGAIVCALLGIGGAFVIPKTPVEKRDASVSAWKRADAPGCLTGIAGLVLINVAWNQGPVAGWTRPYVYILLIIGFVIIGLYGYIESRAEYPLLPVKALNSETAFVLGCIAAGWGAFSIWLFYYWQFNGHLRHWAPLLTSASLVPCAVSGICAAMTTGFLLGRMSPSYVMLMSMAAFLIGSSLVGTTPVDQTYWGQSFFACLIISWGMDMSFPAATIILSDALPRKHQGAAASLVNTILNYSISIALGMAGTIEGHVNNGGQTDEDLLKGYRGALYFGMGLGALGVLVALASVLDTRYKARKARSRASEIESGEKQEA